MAARLKERYEKEIRPAMIERFGYSSPMQAPKIEKIVVNMGVGDAKQDSKMLEAAQEQLATITGQHPNIRRSKKSIAQFKLREGMPVGLAVTLRGERLYEFLDRLMSVAIPRIRDFRGLNPKAFDGRGNYALGVREQIIFPEIDYDAVDQVRGLDITMTTSAKTDEEAYALLELFGMPFAKPAAKPVQQAAAPEAEELEAETEAEASAEEAVEAEPAADEAPEAEETEAEPEADSEPGPEAEADADAAGEEQADTDTAEDGD
jgi:large subunit ribosomal protein L5